MSNITQILSQASQDRLTQFAQKLQVPLPELTDLYNETFKKIEAGTLGKFPDQASKEQYACAVVWGNFVGRPPMSDYAVIPVAFEPKSVTANGAVRASIFALIAPTGSDSWEYRNIACTGDSADLVYNISLFFQYPLVKLAKFAQSADLFADNRTKFEHPQLLAELSQTEAQIAFFESSQGPINATRVKIAEAGKNPTKVDAQGFPIRTDLRIIEGVITRKGGGTRDNGTKWANYVISDDTVSNELKVTPDGRTIYPGLTVWLDPTMQKYNENDQCIFIGTVVANKSGKGKDRKPDGTYSMNAFNVIPLYYDASKAQ
jgi:hypothetical protein